jgi:hypothetical protein
MNVQTPMAMQAMDTQGLNRSPILAAFQKRPRKLGVVFLGGLGGVGERVRARGIGGGGEGAVVTCRVPTLSSA